MKHRIHCIVLALVLASCANHRPGTESAAESKPTRAAPSAVSPATAAVADKVTGGVSETEFKALHEAPTGTVPAPKGQPVTIAGAQCYLSLPEGAQAPLPGVVVIHEWWGLNDNVRHWTDRIAAEGYAALAVDLYGGTVAKTSDEAMAAVKQVDDARATELMLAAHRFLVKDARIRAPRTGSIGWCFGGRKSLQLALAEPALDAAVVYYGNPITEAAQLAPLRAKVLGVFGQRDRSIPPEKVAAFGQALEAAGKTFAIREYDAEHAFANPSNPRYDQENAEKAWAEVRAFLRRELKP